MKKIIFVLLILITSVCVFASSWDVVENAKKIEIKEALISIGKHYDIFVDGSKVGTVTGEWITVMGDTFTIEDNSGNVIMSEKQIRRTFRFSIDRLAIVEDSRGNEIGFFGEEKINDLFNPFSKFHFYDADQNELGMYKAKLAVVKKGDFLDNRGNIEYSFEKKFLTIVDTYTLNVKKNDDIPVEWAIFMVCIQDAISDAND